MLNKRIIPVLLLQNNGFYKTVKFRKPIYIGDPINTIRIFNEKEVDELIILDISAHQKSSPNFELLKQITPESFSPMAYGGGITSLDHAKKIFSIGFEKIVLNTLIHSSPKIVESIARMFGSQALVGSIEVKRNILRQPQVYTKNGTLKIKVPLAEYVKKITSLGVGEIFVNDIDREGTYKGYDVDLMDDVVTHSNIPVIAYGGTHSLENICEIFSKTGVSAAAASSIFIYHGIHKAVLINYPTFEENEKIKNGKY
jgi:cyclase